jgi:hypothetical protein
MGLWMLYGLGVLYIAGPSVAIALAGAVTRTTASVVTRAASRMWNGGGGGGDAERAVPGTRSPGATALSTVTIVH